MSAELLIRAFSAYLSKNLFPSNMFYRMAKNDTAFVNANSVQLPHAGTIPIVKLDRTTKGVASKRTDTASEYKLHELSADPTWLQYSEALVVAYDKRASIVEEHINALNTAVADYMATAWGGSDNVSAVRTTGADRAVSGVPTGTGTRKRFVLADLQSGIKKLNEDNIPQAGRYCVITPAFMDDLLQITEVKSSDFNKVQPLVEGSIGRFMGVDFFVRSKVNIFTTGGTIRPYSTAVSKPAAATDCAGAILWNKDFVRFAHGSSEVFLNVGDAELYGSKLSAVTRVGGLAARADGKGVVNIVEAV